jgi:hypothetical protein
MSMQRRSFKSKKCQDLLKHNQGVWPVNRLLQFKQSKGVTV